MTNEQLKRANIIQEEIDLLEKHRKKLIAANFFENFTDLSGLSFEFNRMHPSVELMSILIIPEFKIKYLENLNNRIKKLTEEFENL